MTYFYRVGGGAWPPRSATGNLNNFHAGTRHVYLIFSTFQRKLAKWFRLSATQWIQRKVINLESMLSVHCTALHGHVNEDILLRHWLPFINEVDYTSLNSFRIAFTSGSSVLRQHNRRPMNKYLQELLISGVPVFVEGDCTRQKVAKIFKKLKLFEIQNSNMKWLVAVTLSIASFYHCQSY